jgi:cell division protein FtsQ
MVDTVEPKKSNRRGSSRPDAQHPPRRASRGESVSRASTTPRPRATSAQRPKKRSARSDTRPTSSPTMPPVMARRGMEGMAARQPGRKSRTAPKRRYDVALGKTFLADVPGAEVRLPSLPSVHLGWRLISGLMLLALAACLVFAWQSPTFRVSSVETEGLQRLTLTDLNAVISGPAGVFGRPVFELDAKALEQILQQSFPEFSSVSVRMSLPATVKISVTERQPVLAWLQDGAEVWVDAEGISFPPRGNPGTLVRIKAQSAPAGSLPTDTASEATAEALLVSPIVGSDGAALQGLKLQPELVAAILILDKAAKETASSDPVLLYNTAHGLGWNEPRGWKVFFGLDLENLDQKLLVYQALAARLNHDGIQPAFVSVEYLHAPYYRMER